MDPSEAIALLKLSVVSIGGKSFINNSLTEVNIKSPVASIGYGAFKGNNLTTINIGDSVTSIGYGAFLDNDLTEVILPSHFELDPPFDAFDEGVTFLFSDDIELDPNLEPVPVHYKPPTPNPQQYP